jgi:copper(I)-binding protein
MKRAASAALATCLCAIVALPGCKPAPAGAPQTGIAATAAPEAKPGIALSNLRIVLPRIADRPGALYFSVTNAGSMPATLIGVFVDGATKAEMHETKGNTMKPLTKVVLDPGATLAFAPGGKHVMLYGIPGTWKATDKPAVTLKFADGDKISGKAAVEKAQGAEPVPAATGTAGAMPGMKM